MHALRRWGFHPARVPDRRGRCARSGDDHGQAPGAVGLTTGLPSSGRAGAELRRWLARRHRRGSSAVPHVHDEMLSREGARWRRRSQAEPAGDRQLRSVARSRETQTVRRSGRCRSSTGMPRPDGERQAVGSNLLARRMADPTFLRVCRFVRSSLRASLRGETRKCGGTTCHTTTDRLGRKHDRRAAAARETVLVAATLAATALRMLNRAKGRVAHTMRPAVARGWWSGGRAC